MDKLAIIFDLQKQLNKRVGVDSDNMTEKEQIHWLLQFSRALQQENSELIDSLPWKWWADYQTFDKQNACVEVVDMLHFLVSMAQILGMSEEDLFKKYCEKHKLNNARQDSGYSTKDETDTRGI